MTNSIGLVPGSLAGAFGYRGDLKGQGRRTLVLCIPAVMGAMVGALLLLRLPPRVFEVAVPLLVAAASLGLLAKPLLDRAATGHARHPAVLPLALFGVGTYGGYFGAAQGIMLLAALGLLMNERLQRINGFKTVIAAATNMVSGLIFAFLAPVSWPFAIALGVGSTAGGWAGAVLSRRLPEAPLRVAIAVFGLLVAVRLGLTAYLR